MKTSRIFLGLFFALFIYLCCAICQMPLPSITMNALANRDTQTPTPTPPPQAGWSSEPQTQWFSYDLWWHSGNDYVYIKTNDQYWISPENRLYLPYVPLAQSWWDYGLWLNYWYIDNDTYTDEYGDWIQVEDCSDAGADWVTSYSSNAAGPYSLDGIRKDNDDPPGTKDPDIHFNTDIYIINADFTGPSSVPHQPKLDGSAYNINVGVTLQPKNDLTAKLQQCKLKIWDPANTNYYREWSSNSPEISNQQWDGKLYYGGNANNYKYCQASNVFMNVHYDLKPGYPTDTHRTINKIDAAIISPRWAFQPGPFKYDALTVFGDSMTVSGAINSSSYNLSKHWSYDAGVYFHGGANRYISNPDSDQPVLNVGDNSPGTYNLNLEVYKNGSSTGIITNVPINVNADWIGLAEFQFGSGIYDNKSFQMFDPAFSINNNSSWYTITNQINLSGFGIFLTNHTENWDCFKAMSFAINGTVIPDTPTWYQSVPAGWRSFDQTDLANGTIKLKRGDAIHLVNHAVDIEHGVVVTNDYGGTSITDVSVWSANMPNFSERTIGEYLSDPQHNIFDPMDVEITIFKNPNCH